MPSYDITLEDTSPLWQYKSADQWWDSHPDDPEQDKYQNTTFHSTNLTDASVSITFNGIGVQLFGAYRFNHGNYSVAVGGSRTTGNGYRHDPNTEADFRQQLFGKTDLPLALHNVELTNEDDGSWLDLDFGVLTLGDNDSSTEKQDIAIDDRDSNITYQGDWDDRPNDKADKYYKNSMHVVNVTGATATIKFYGNVVTVFGAISSNHGAYTASLDGATAQTFNGYHTDFHPQQVLYLASSLPLTDHTLTLTHKDPDPATYFDLDYVVISRWLNSTQLPDENSPPVDAIAGGAVGGVAALAALGVLVWFLLRRRRQRRNVAWEHARFDVDPLPPPVSASAASAPLPPTAASTAAGAMSEKQRASRVAEGVSGAEENRIRPLLVPTVSPPPGYD